MQNIHLNNSSDPATKRKHEVMFCLNSVGHETEAKCFTTALQSR